LKTSDGGKSWVSQKSGTKNHVYDVAFADTEHGLAVTNYEVLSTIDGGVTWTVNTSAKGGRVAMLDPQHAVVVGSGTTYVTTTGGQNWQQGKNYDVYGDSITIFSLTSVWVLGNGRIYRSDDGGLGFSVENLKGYGAGAVRDVAARTVEFQEGKSMHFGAPTAGWVVGYDGSIKKY
jgi:photosystem II stability/assembly factor-like uncharacterized protein